MAVRLAKDQVIDLDFYATDGGVVILAAWDENEEQENPALEFEILTKYFSSNRGGV